MTDSVRTMIELGTKGKRAVAYAVDWPGWSRGAKTEAHAQETLEHHRNRYRPIAALAGRATEFEESGPLEVAEQYVGIGSTDFWGVSFRWYEIEAESMSDDEFERRLTQLQARWAYFDAVAERVSQDMKLGPPGGGRMRDESCSTPASGVSTAKTTWLPFENTTPKARRLAPGNSRSFSGILPFT